MQPCSKPIIVLISRIKLFKLGTATKGLRGAGGAPVVGRHVVDSSLVPCRAALEQMKKMKYCTLGCPECDGLSRTCPVYAPCTVC